MPESAPKTTSTPPLIIVSYSKEEEKWKDKLVSLFPTDVDLRLVFNRVEDNPERIDEETWSALSEANVLIFLLSPSYLGASWITNQQADRVSELENSRGLKVVPVLLRYSSWEEIPLLRTRQLVTSDGKPIAEDGSDGQTRALQFVASRVLELAGLRKTEQQTTSSSASSGFELAKELKKFTFTDDAGTVVERAKLLSTFKREDPGTITSVGLLFALAEIGREQSPYTKTPQFLWRELTRRGGTRYENAFIAAFPDAKTESAAKTARRSSYGLSANARKAFQLAQTISIRTIKLASPPGTDIAPPLSDGRIHTRHLLAGLLKLWVEEPFAGAMSVFMSIMDEEVFRKRFFDFIVESVPDDDHEAWRGILVVDVPKEMTTAQQPKEAVAENIIQGNIEAPVNVIRQTVISERPLVTNVDESPSILPESFPNLGESVFTQSSQTVTNFSELEAELSGTYRADQTQQEPEVPATSDDQDQAASASAVDEELDLKPILAGFATDFWDGKDLLDTTQDVNALASLVSAWSVEPPLSIGLFGDWGSGKSHFMRQMRKRVEKLSRSARRATDKKQKDIGYYKNIVQIEFNAWHYIEGNLWASLVDHIFANLRVAEKEPFDLVEKRRDQLMDDLGVKKEIEAKLKTKIEEKKSQLDAKKQEAIDRASEAETKREDASKALAGFRNEAETQLNELQLPINFSKADQDLLERFGIKPADLSTPGDVRKRYDELKGFWHRLNVQLKLFKTDPRVKRRWLFAGLLVLIPFLGLLLSKLPQVKALPAGLASALTFIATLYAAAKPTWDQFRKGLKALEEQDEAIERERQKRMAELQGEVSALTKTLIDAENEKASIQTEIANLEHKIQTTTTSTILAEFIEDRAAASDYRRHLGLLALIRRDFEKLRDLFDRQRKDEKEGKENEKETKSKDRYPINRIVLYIDDLDRCPPQRVVEVLQAIHLLLAFPIFVVVVGVDARWVTRSLQESYEWLRFEDADNKKDDADADVDGQDEQGATPHDYLEKIFQIPFWLRPMEETQTKIFIEGLTEQVRYRPKEKQRGDGNEQTANGSQAGDQLMQTDVVPEGKESAASGNGHSPQTVTGPVVESVPSALGEDGGIAAINQPDKQTVAADTSTGVAGAGLADHQVATATADTPVTNIDSEQQATAKTEEVAELKREEDDEDEEEDEEKIDLTPHSLTLGDEEIEYMKSLAEFIGRSPRAVKRFLNCYRLIKVSLSPKELEEFVRKGESYEYRAVMILLGIITGAPTVSLFVTEEIENWKWDKENRPTMADFNNQLEKNEELRGQPDWARLKTFFSGFRATEESANLFAAFKKNTPRVSRYSFRISRAEAAGPKRTSTTSQSKPTAAPKSVTTVPPKASS